MHSGGGGGVEGRSGGGGLWLLSDALSDAEDFLSLPDHCTGPVFTIRMLYQILNSAYLKIFANRLFLRTFEKFNLNKNITFNIIYEPYIISILSL